MLRFDEIKLHKADKYRLKLGSYIVCHFRDDFWVNGVIKVFKDNRVALSLNGTLIVNEEDVKRLQEKIAEMKLFKTN